MICTGCLRKLTQKIVNKIIAIFVFFIAVFAYIAYVQFSVFHVLVEVDCSVFPKMKRKVAKVGELRLSPNEETMLLKEEYERRRKLRLQQVCLYFFKLSISFKDVTNNFGKSIQFYFI